jgi:hypothetical protein
MLMMSFSGHDPHRTLDHQQRCDEIVVVDVLTACLPAAIRQTISRAQSMNRFTAGLRVRFLSVTSATGHGRTGSSNGSTLSRGCLPLRRRFVLAYAVKSWRRVPSTLSDPVRLASYGVVVSTGNGCHPMSCPAQLGCCSVASLRPHKRGRHQ